LPPGGATSSWMPAAPVSSRYSRPIETFASADRVMLVVTADVVDQASIMSCPLTQSLAPSLAVTRKLCCPAAAVLNCPRQTAVKLSAFTPAGAPLPKSKEGTSILECTGLPAKLLLLKYCADRPPACCTT